MLGLTAVEVFICIIIIYILIYCLTPEKNIWFPFLLIVVLLSVLAYKFEPGITDDLDRYYRMLNNLRGGGLDYLNSAISSGLYDWDTYRMCGYYFYFISRFPNNHYISAVTIFIVYGLMFLTIYKAVKRFNISKNFALLGSLFFLSTYWYYDTASGIRNGLTFAVIFACAYYHLVERKHIPLCYLGYILACFTHSAGAMLVALVILTELTLNNSGKFLNFLLVFGLMGGGALIQYLATISDNSFIQSLAGQAEAHQASDALSSATYFYVNVATSLLVAILIFYFSFYILNSDYSTQLKRIYKFSSIVLFFMVGSLYSSLIFIRFARWIVPIIGALIYMIGSQLQFNDIRKKGITEITYHSPSNESVRIKLKPVLNIAFVAYIAVHFWYACTGSSLIWMHF